MVWIFWFGLGLVFCRFFFVLMCVCGDCFVLWWWAFVCLFSVFAFFPMLGYDKTSGLIRHVLAVMLRKS